MTAAVEPEETVVVPAAEDAVQALGGADRDGLLTYHGYVTGGRYEVSVDEQDMILSADQAVLLAHRLRAVDALRQSGLNVSVAVSGAAGRLFTLTVSGRRFDVAGAEVVDWCAGFQAAMQADGVEHAGEDQVAEIAELFERPTLDDQCRMVILGLQHGSEYVSTVKIRERIGQMPGVDDPPAPKTILDALAFGGYLSSDLCEKLIAAFGYRWTLVGGEFPAAPVDGVGGGPLPQMPALVALRRIVEASRAGWVRYVGQRSPNRARRLKTFYVAVGSSVFDLQLGQVVAWLAGVADFHGLRSRR